MHYDPQPSQRISCSECLIFIERETGKKQIMGTIMCSDTNKGFEVGERNVENVFLVQGVLNERSPDKVFFCKCVEEFFWLDFFESFKTFVISLILNKLFYFETTDKWNTLNIFYIFHEFSSTFPKVATQRKKEISRFEDAIYI